MAKIGSIHKGDKVRLNNNPDSFVFEVTRVTTDGIRVQVREGTGYAPSWADVSICVKVD